MAATMYPHMYCEGGGHNHESLRLEMHGICTCTIYTVSYTHLTLPTKRIV